VNDLPNLSDYFTVENHVHMHVQKAASLLHVFDVLAFLQLHTNIF